MAVTLSIGILTHNRRAAVLEAIESVVSHQGGVAAEVVVVDSASTDGTAEAVVAKYPRVKLIRLPRNLGCPSGRNHVYANCSGDVIVNLDDDGRLAAGMLPLIADAFVEDEHLGVLAFRQQFTDEPQSHRSHSDAACEVSAFSGGVCAMRRSMLTETGGYPYDFFLFGEETFLALKAMDAGYRIVSRPDIVMWHPRVGGSSGSELHDYLKYRNALLVVTRLYPAWMVTQYLSLKAGKYLFDAIRKRCLWAWLKAVLAVAADLPLTLSARKPCRAETIRKHLSLCREAITRNETRTVLG